MCDENMDVVANKLSTLDITKDDLPPDPPVVDPFRDCKYKIIGLDNIIIRKKKNNYKYIIKHMIK